MRLLAPLAVVAVAVALAWPTLDADFLGDDFGYVGLYHRGSLLDSLKLEDISRGIWGHPQDELRPVFALSFKVAALLFGVNPRGHHVLNLLLHAASALVLSALALTLTRGRVGTALAAGLLFAASPVHAETIAWITGRVDSLPTFFFLSSLLAYVLFRRDGLRRHHALSLAAFALGMFSKEILVVLPPLLVLLDQWRPWGVDAERARPSLAASIRSSIPFLAISAGYFALRWSAFRSVAREERLGLGALATFAARQPDDLRALLLPVGTLVAWILAALLVAWLAVLVRRRSAERDAVAGVLYFGPAWYALTVLPLVVTYPSARHLYLPSCGLSLALALLLFPAATGRSLERLLRIGTAVLVFSVFASTLRAREEEWIHAGSVSRRVRSDIERLAGGLPAGSTVVLSGIPSYEGDAFVWQWALPYALEPPFTSEDLYARLRILEPPGNYCCPPRKWWQEKSAVVEALLDGPADEALVLYGLHWNPQKQAVFLQRGRLARGQLRTQVERALRRPFEGLVEPDEPALRRLLAALAAAARQAPDDP